MLVVLDADIVIAGTLASASVCHDILDIWLAGDFELATCPRLLWEVEKALKHPRIAGRYQLDAPDIDSWVRRLGAESSLYDDPENPPPRVPNDPADDYLIQLALDSGAAALVSRDRHLDGADIPAGLQLLRPAQFVVWVRA